MREGDYYFGDKEMEIQTSPVHSIQTLLATICSNLHFAMEPNTQKYMHACILSRFSHVRLFATPGK